MSIDPMLITREVAEQYVNILLTEYRRLTNITKNESTITVDREAIDS